MQELHEFCNLGYARPCPRLPPERSWDSVRFGVRISAVESTAPGCIQVRYVCERDHLPAEHGSLEFDPSQPRWTKQHPDARVQRMAECFVATYLERRNHRMMALAAG